MNIGYSSRLIYDQKAYEDQLSQSVAPINYTINENYDYNCNECFSCLGPRTSLNGNSVSIFGEYRPATKQYLTDVESILTNRNVPLTKDKCYGVNPVNLLKYNMNNLKTCNKFLDPISSHLSLPPANSRGLAINRFYDLHQNPQENIFWDFSVNSSLEAKDNHIVKFLTPMYERNFPNGLQGPNEQNFTIYTDGTNVTNNKCYDAYCQNKCNVKKYN